MHFSRRHSGEHSCEIILNVYKWFGRIYRLKEVTSKILFLAMVDNCSAEQNCLLNFGSGHYGEQSCEFMLILD